MQEQTSPINAAIDIGSNTIHIVVASCRPDSLDIIEDEQELVRIGESVTATGEISPQKREAAITTLHRYQKLAQQHEAKRVLAVATEAIRQARNNTDFIEQVHREVGLQIQLISGEAEAELTFLGATYENRSNQNSSTQLGVMDLGGGSMELVTARDRQIAWRTSIPIGSGWLHDHYLPSNPPSNSELASAQNYLSNYFHNMHIEDRPKTLIVTGGSANSLMLLARRAFGLDRASNRLMADVLLACENLLRKLKAEEVAQEYELPLSRARILLAGLVIIQEVMKYLDLKEIHVTNHGIREGVLLAYRRYGEHWLEHTSINKSLN